MIHVGGNHARARRARHAYVQAELERSVGEFVARDDGRVVARKLMTEELRDSAIFVINGRLFATEKFIASSKKRGHAIMLSSTIRNGGLTNTAYAHVSGADGGATGPPCINGTGYEVPTTVIAKRSGYAQCGILVPNPYFGRGDLHGAWARQQDHIRQRSIQVNGTDPRVFWRGSCLNHENRDGRLATNHPGKDETLTQEEKWGETTCSRDRGNRARMLGAALSVARPDLFDVKCSRSAPPSDFSCVSGQERWEHDQARSSVVRNPAKVLDDAWVEAEDYARYQYLLNLPGETSGSYSRNLNHLRGGGVFRWATGAVVLLWNARLVEWYYPALAHLQNVGIVDTANAIKVVEGLNDPRYSKARAQLALGARVVDRELVCPDCIATYLRRVAAAVARRCFGNLLDDAGKLAAVAASVDGACDAFMEVLVQPKKVDGQIQYTKVEAGRRACDVWKDAGSS